jgi:serine/threonine-protein kinase
MSAEQSQTETPLAEALIGTTLRGTYQILDVLDQGGMGMVFTAEHLRLKRRLAVKLLAKHLADDRQALARFHREAEIISQLTHPNIVQVVDFDTTDDGEPYLVMELLQGESLDTRLERQRSLPVPEAIRITTQTAAGLTAAHQADIVHRDLKPGNVFLVDIPGGNSFVKLLDFGISKRAGGSRALTGEFDILGTPDYMAPEQASGKTAQVDHRGDQFALAVISYQMLTGALPFAGNDVMEILKRVLNDSPARASVLNEALPEAIDPVLAKALSKNPDDRYPTIGAFAQELAMVSGCSLPPGFSMHPARSAAPASNQPTLADPSWSNPERPVMMSEQAERAPAGARASQSPVTGTRRKGREQGVSSETANLVESLLGKAREALNHGHSDSAVDLAEQALGMATTSDDVLAQKNVIGSEGLLTRIFEGRLGSLTRPVLIDESGGQLEVGHPYPDHLSGPLANAVDLQGGVLHDL